MKSFRQNVHYRIRFIKINSKFLDSHKEKVIFNQRYKTCDSFLAILGLILHYERKWFIVFYRVMDAL